MARLAHNLVVALTLSGAAACSLVAPSDADLTGGPAPALACGPGEKACGASCVSVASPATGCAAASCAPCAYDHGAPLCVGGACALGPCESGFADCDGTAPNGCEADLRRSATSCGACGKACVLASPYCDVGACVPQCHAVRFVFATTTAYIPPLDPPLGTGDLTFETWVRWHGEFVAPAAGKGLLFATNNQSGADSFSADCLRAGGKLACRCAITADDTVEDARCELPADGWHHLACVRSSGTLTAWCDGAPGTSSPSTTSLTSAAEMAFGHDPRGHDAEPVNLGPTRLSRVARYVEAFLPRRAYAVDGDTAFQYLTTTPFDGSHLVDESGHGLDALAVVQMTWEASNPCE